MAIYDVNGNVLNEASAYPSLSLFHSFGVIGDSYASGEIYISSLVDYYDLSWPQVLGRAAGLKAVNYSKGGLSTKTWLENNDYGLAKLNSEDVNDIYVIALGLNDANQSIPVGTISDITSDSANSFYSYYGRIIRAIQSHAPNAIIILSTCPRWSDTYNPYSDAIIDIGEYYTLSVLDLSESEFFQSNFFSSNQVQNHPTAVNYSAMAKEYGRLIEKVLQDNVANYNGYTRNGTHDNPEGTGLTDEIKEALLTCFAHIPWLDHDIDYYSILENALYDTYPKIIASFNPGVNVIYTDDTLDSLKQYLTVTYYETVESAGTIVSANDYTLSGTLAVGTNTIDVSYNTLTTSITINNVIDFYDIWEWSWSASGGNLQKLQASVDPGQTDLTKYPSGVFIYAPYDARRHYCVTRGQAPYYVRDSTAVASSYYPIPIPRSANHVKITTLPDGQYIYLTFYEFDGTKYDPRLGRTTWTQMTNGSFERPLALGSGNQRYLIFNMKSDDAETSYPVEPTSMLIEFSEVET